MLFAGLGFSWRTWQREENGFESPPTRWPVFLYHGNAMVFDEQTAGHQWHRGLLGRDDDICDNYVSHSANSGQPWNMEVRYKHLPLYEALELIRMSPRSYQVTGDKQLLPPELHDECWLESEPGKSATVPRKTRRLRKREGSKIVEAKDDRQLSSFQHQKR